MSDSSKAVFLSYASQDAVAAKRICDALCTAGVEVWFDQSELRGGDAWDAKIRKQIKECALFVPIISANTQARPEGYFRLEWKLADRRTDLIGKSKAFLLPVCVDDTRDADADVPDSFLAVQWVRVPGGAASDEFCARVKSLLESGTGVSPVISQPAPDARATATGKSRQWLAPAIAGVVAILGLALWQPWKTTRPHETKSTAPLSEARQLVAKAWLLLNKTGLDRPALEAANEFCQRAVALDSTDPEVWAAWSQVDTWYVFHNFGNKPQRRESAQAKASRALQLAPRSFEARLAQACYLVRGPGDFEVSLAATEAERLLLDLLKEEPDEPRALFALGILLRNLKRPSEAREVYGRLARNPLFAVIAWSELGWAEDFAREYRAAGAAVDRAIALLPFPGNLLLKIELAQYWHGDLARAKTVLDQMPVSALLEDPIAYRALSLAWWRHDPQHMLRVLDGMPHEWLSSNWFEGPKAYWTARAQQMNGRPDAAQVEWRIALKAVEQKLTEKPNSTELLHLKGELLAQSGDRAEAGKAFRLAQDLGLKTSSTDLVLLGESDEAMTVLENAVAENGSRHTAARLRLDPRFDSVRDHPRFRALQARLDADPRFSPTAEPANAKLQTQGTELSRPLADPKSVAVLAFTNLSGDKENEYFSDGISEELLTVLQKIPGVRVAARTSAFYFKGKQVPLAEIAKQLSVAYVVEGSVQKAGPRVRINAKLIKAADGFQVWSDKFEREWADIFAVQDEIAGRIAQALSVRLVMSPSAPTAILEAYDTYLKARSALARRGAGSLTLARQQFEAALALDPDFAPARVGLARTLSIIALYSSKSGSAQRELAEGAEREARRTIARDPANAEAWSVLGTIDTFYFWRWREAGEETERALALAPNDPEIANFAGDYYRTTRDVGRMLAMERRAVELNPLHAINHSDLAGAYFLLPDYEAATRHARDALALNPTLFDPYAILVWSLGELGRFDEMRAAIAAARTQTREPEPYHLGLAVSAAVAEGRRTDGLQLQAQLVPFAEKGEYRPARLGLDYLRLGDSDAAARWLQRAYETRDSALVFFSNAQLQQVAADPKARIILEKPELRELVQIRARNAAAWSNK